MPDRDDVLRQRLATQRLTSAPLAGTADVVRLLTCAQAQDPPLARYSLGLRSEVPDREVRAVLDSGAVIRAHILRPTWHYVAVEDLRWILALTSAKVESGMAARTRHLGLEGQVLDEALVALVDLLSGDQLTRKQLGERLTRGVSLSGEQLGHVLLLGELRGLFCSGRLQGNAHTYALVVERVPAGPPLERSDAVRRLVRRFFGGHGPASVSDLLRWTTLTKTEVRAALSELAGALESTEVEGETLWLDPEVSEGGGDGARAFLLPTFDEAFLSYPRLGFPRGRGHPRGDQPHSFAEAGGGPVICDLRDVGWWKRTLSGGRVDVLLAVSGSLTRAPRAAVEEAAEAFAGFAGLELRLHKV